MICRVEFIIFIIDNLLAGFNSDTKSLNLNCGGILTLAVRDGIFDMEVAARQFEQEENVLHEVEKHSDEFLFPSSIYSVAKSEGYLGLSTEISQIQDQLRHHPPLRKGTTTAETKTSYEYNSGFGSPSLIQTEYPHINVSVRSTLSPNLFFPFVYMLC